MWSLILVKHKIRYIILKRIISDNHIIINDYPLLMAISQNFEVNKKLIKRNMSGVLVWFNGQIGYLYRAKISRRTYSDNVERRD